MAQILIDVTEVQLQVLVEKAHVQKKPLAVIVCDAIDAYVSEDTLSEDTSGVFGLWAGRAMHGFGYQAARRAEW